MEHRDDLDFAEAFQDAVDAVRRAVDRLGVICSDDDGFTLQQVHELMLIATRLSEWCTERSHGPELPDGTTLTPRQCEVERLFVDNRTELANVLRTWAARPRAQKPERQPLRALISRG